MPDPPLPGSRSGSRPRPHRPVPTGAAWPRPADPGAASRLRERFADLGAAEARLAAKGAGRAALDALGGNSPYLADLAVREAATFRQMLREGPDKPVAQALATLGRVSHASPRQQVASALRQAKRQVALAAALADLGGAWSLEQVTGALSDLAQAALRLSCDHLLRAAHDRGALRLPFPDQPGRGSGWAVLGMGKLGARELNYSSDVDLVLFYDPERHAYHDGSQAASPGAFPGASPGASLGASLGAVFSRLSRDLVTLMEARDADGYVFRTDLRLRPDPAATPPCVAIPAALTYYESMGQNWERAAMIKARPIAGDLDCGARFLAEIRPFVWRRGLDFAAVTDIQAMKARLDQHKQTALATDGDAVARLLGHDVKLGQGGIREIEFLAQTLQLVWGGRNPALRIPATLDALPALARAGRLEPDAVPELEAAYRALRATEHRLQMVADRQTHALPDTPEEMDRFAVFMGAADGADFAAGLLRHMDRVRARWAEVFEPVREAAPVGTLPVGTGAEAADGPVVLDFSGPDPRPETEQALAAMGYRQPGAAMDAVRGWRAGGPRALRSERARGLLDHLLPALLGALAALPDPDAALMRLDALLVRLPAGVQILSLFQRNPALLERVAAVLGAAPSLADHLASVPSALDGLLAPAEVDPDPAATLRAQLEDARALEDAVAIVRRTVRGEEFRLGIAQMQGRLDADAAGLARTALADAALSALLPRVLRDHARRYGRVPGGGMVVVLLGKAGGREMMAGSDLDLMLVYHHPEDAQASTGPRPLPPSTWFIRAAHAFVAAVTAPGAEGALYAADMRLRPSGNKGPVAVPLAGFVRYHAEDAWTWERMALTRARVVAGPPALRRRVRAAIADVLRLPMPPGRASRADAASMRSLMLRELPPSGPWDVKLRPGGQVDVEFVAQVLQLLHGPAYPVLFSPTTRVALRRLRAAGLLPSADAAILLRADLLWRTVQGMLRILVGRGSIEGRSEPDLPAATAEALGGAAGAVLGESFRDGGRAIDLSALRARMDQVAAEVESAFARHVGQLGIG